MGSRSRKGKVPQKTKTIIAAAVIIIILAAVIYVFYGGRPLGLFVQRLTISQYKSAVTLAPADYTIVVPRSTPAYTDPTLGDINTVQVAANLANFFGIGEQATRIDSDTDIPPTNLILIGKSGTAGEADVNAEINKLFEQKKICAPSTPTIGAADAVIVVVEDKLVIIGTNPAVMQRAVDVLKGTAYSSQLETYGAVVRYDMSIVSVDFSCPKVEASRAAPSSAQVNQLFEVTVSLTINEVPEGGITLIGESLTGEGKITLANPTATILSDKLVTWMNPQADSAGVGMSSTGAKTFKYTLKGTAAGTLTLSGRVGWTEGGQEKSIQTGSSSITISATAECTEGVTESCGSSIGECRQGTRTCTNGVWGTCIGAVDPTTEVCTDNKDNDCDGLTDAADIIDCPCTDTDGGLNYYSRGNATYAGTTYTDSCNADNTAVIEYICGSSGAASVTWNCSTADGTATSCSEGACSGTAPAPNDILGKPNIADLFDSVKTTQTYGFKGIIGKTAQVDDSVGVVDIAGTLKVGEVKLDTDSLLDTETKIRSSNLFVVGGPCVNKLAATLMGKTWPATYPAAGEAASPTDCTYGFEQNKGFVRIYQKAGRIQIVVAGLSGLDTRRAARAVVKYTDHRTKMNKRSVIVSGTTLDVGDVVADTSTYSE